MIFDSKPRARDIFAITQGDYEGEMWVFIEDDRPTRSYQFLALPTMVNRECTYEMWRLGAEHSIFDKVERLPKDVWTTCKKQFEFNADCGREQSGPPSILDFEKQGIRPRRWFTPACTHFSESSASGGPPVREQKSSNVLGFEEIFEALSKINIS